MCCFETICHLGNNGCKKNIFLQKKANFGFIKMTNLYFKSTAKDKAWDEMSKQYEEEIKQ